VADHINSLCHDVDPIKFPHKRLWKDCEAQTSTLKNKFDKTKAVRNKMIALTKVGIVCPGNILSGRPYRHVTLPSKAHNVKSK